jgi:glucose-6-phosphate-specific signal transduction histidine kinase
VVLPLTALLLLGTLEDGGWWRAALLGAALGGSVFVEYYTAVYAALLVVTMVAARSVTFVRVPRLARPWQRVLLRTLAVLAAVLLIAIAIVARTGGTTLSVGGLRISVRGIDNPVAALGLIALIAAIVAWLPRLRVRVAPRRMIRDAVRVPPPPPLRL